MVSVIVEAEAQLHQRNKSGMPTLSIEFEQEYIW